MHPSQPSAFVRTLRVLFILTAFAISSPLLRAQIYNEVGDAGSTQGTAQNTGFNIGPSGGQWTIFGTIGPTNANDADVYRLVLNAPYLFSATTVNPLTAASGGAGGLDTQLFLFDSAGNPIFANNDANGTTLQSTLPGRSSFTFSLGAGTYYLAISLSGNYPVNSNNQLVFATGGGDPTAIRGMASGINPTNWNDFDNFTSVPQTGAYQINIFSLPESGSTVVLMLVALGAIAVLRRRLVA
ncbi:MAG: DVUA0089 family protein [Chthoniobacterales bacterium]